MFLSLSLLVLALATNACEVEANIRDIRDMLAHNQAQETEFQVSFKSSKRTAVSIYSKLVAYRSVA